MRFSYSFYFKILLTFSLVFLGYSTYAQGDYLVTFRDKVSTTYSINKPQAYLSPRAIQRRKNLSINISLEDLPIADTYLNAIKILDCKIHYTLKWENAVVIYTNSQITINQIKELPFVVAIKKINSYGASTRHKSLAPASSFKNDTTISSTYYGAAAPQIDMIRLDSLHQLGYWGDEVLIAVMDAGFTSANHNRFFKKIFDEGRVLYTHDYVGDSTYVYATSSHGCATFGCIGANIPNELVGTAPNAKFLLFTTEDNNSETIREEYNWAKAAEIADSLGAEVFSTSLGYTTFDASDSQDDHTYATMNGHTTPAARAANRAASKGILVINSAGNEGAAAWHYIATPADADSCVAVGAVTPTGSIANFSSRGPSSSGMVKPSICAQGAPAYIVSTNSTVTTAYGTSFSGPIIAGAFACLRQAFPTVPNMAIIDAVQRSANYAAAPNADYGYGIPDFSIAYHLLQLHYAPVINALLAFPSPFHDSFTIVYPATSTPQVSAALYDTKGSKVWTLTFAPMPLPLNHIDIINLQQLPPAVYILKVNETAIRIVKE